MTIVPILPDEAPVVKRPTPDAQLFGATLDAVWSALSAAQTAEDRFAAGTGDLFTSVYQRTRADIALSVASATATRTVQALQTIMNMQV